MATFVERHPALCLFGLAVLLGTAPLLLVSFEILPTGFSQLGALSASAAGFVLAACERGRAGLLELLRRGLVWRAGAGWWVFSLTYTAILAAVVLWLAGLVGGVAVDWAALGPLARIVPMMVILIVFAGLGEEFGWRGYLLPRLQRGHSALAASLIVGVLHSLWHIPLFLVEGTAQHGWAQEVGFLASFLGYAVFVIAWAIQLTWVFNNTGGSVLMVAVVHGAGNAWIGGFFDVAGQAGVVGNGILAALMALFSAAVVAAAGPEHLSRTNARDVLPARNDGDGRDSSE